MLAKRIYTRVVDDSTGDIESESDRPLRSVPNWPGEWWRMELATAQLIRKNRKDLTMTDVAVFFYLVENMGEQNFVREMSQSSIAEVLNTSATAVCRSMRVLFDLGWVQKVAPSTYRIEVRLGWNGTVDDRWEQAKLEGKKPRKRDKSHLKPVPPPT